MSARLPAGATPEGTDVSATEPSGDDTIGSDSVVAGASVGADAEPPPLVLGVVQHEQRGTDAECDERRAKQRTAAWRRTEPR